MFHKRKYAKKLVYSEHGKNNVSGFTRRIENGVQEGRYGSGRFKEGSRKGPDLMKSPWKREQGGAELSQTQNSLVHGLPICCLPANLKKLS